MTDTKPTVKTNFLSALTDPATVRTLIIAAAAVVALVAATGGAINIGNSGELIQELRMTRAELGSLSTTMDQLRFEVVSIARRVDRLEQLQSQPPKDDDRPEPNN